MCAIAGIVGGGLDEQEMLVKRMLASMHHRGPDHSDIQKLAENVIMGHNRLSIIDLSASSNQPFTSEDGRYTIVFNGEIYNYTELRGMLIGDFSFRTNSDTEVLLAAFRKWKERCLDHLIGMFAFAIWDHNEQKLFAARDRFGVKPFYYTEWQSAFLFASEIKALWSAGVPRYRNEKVWASFFVYGSYGMPDETFYRDVHQLPAGHCLFLKEGKVEIKRWYHFEDNIACIQPAWAKANESEITERYFALLRESVKLRFRADVAVGFNVSGGLDSSLLLSLITESFRDNKTIHAFSFYTGNPDYDELPWVKALMDLTSYPLHAVKLNAEDIPWMTDEMAPIQDEPFGGFPTLAYATLFREARMQNTIVLLDGQGMDEAWAGYDYYQSDSAHVVQGIAGSPVRPNVLTDEFRKLAERPLYQEPFQERLLNLQYRDLFFTKIPRALRFNDRISMKYSTELREPFLDHRLVEMAFALPVAWKIKDGRGKYLLREMAANFLPDTIHQAPKRALQTPQREWLGKELRGWADEKINAFAGHPGIDAKSTLKEWKQYQECGGDNSFYIWQWINSTYYQ